MDLGAVADELYGLPPPEFVAARDARAAEARRSGDRDLADAIKKLKRPTVTAWAVNLLVRRRRSEVGELRQLGGALRQAQTRLAGDELRRLSHQRQQLVATLAAEATREAAQAGHPVGDAAVAEVQASLEAAVVDEEAARAVLSGRLTRGLEHAGTGFDVGAASRPGSRPPRTRPKLGDTKAGRPAGPGALRAQERASTARRRLEEVRRGRERAERARRDAQHRVEKLEDDLERRRRELGAAKERLRQARDEERAAEREEEKAKAALRRAGA